MRREDCILFSGGAPGAEGAFGAQAERYGIDEVNYTFEGHTLVRPRGLRVLTHEELLAGDVSLESVSRLMNRRYTEGPTLRKILQTIWYQVNNGQEIYVVGHIEDDMTVRGGTGWGAEFAKACNQPPPRKSRRPAISKTTGPSAAAQGGAPSSPSCATSRWPCSIRPAIAGSAGP